MSSKEKNGPPREPGPEQGKADSEKDGSADGARPAVDAEPEVLHLEGFAIGDAVVRGEEPDGEALPDVMGGFSAAFQQVQQGEIQLDTGALEAIEVTEGPSTPVLEGLTDMFQTVAAEVEAEMEGDVEEIVISGEHTAVPSQPMLHGLTDMFQKVAAEVEAELDGATEQVEFAGASNEEAGEQPLGDDESLPDVLDGFTAAFQQVKQLDPAELAGVVIERRVVDEGDFSEDQPELPDVSDGLTAAFQLVKQTAPAPVEPELEGLEIVNVAIDGEWVPDNKKTERASEEERADDDAEETEASRKVLPTDLHEAVKSYLEDEPPVAEEPKKDLPTDVHKAVMSYLDDAEPVDADSVTEPEPETDGQKSTHAEESSKEPRISIDDYLPKGSQTEPDEPESPPEQRDPEGLSGPAEAPPKKQVESPKTPPKKQVKSPEPPPKKQVELGGIEFARFPSLVQRNVAGPTESNAALPSDDDEVDFQIGMSSGQRGLPKEPPIPKPDPPPAAAVPPPVPDDSGPEAGSEEELPAFEPIVGGFTGHVPEVKKKPKIAPFSLKTQSEPDEQEKPTQEADDTHVAEEVSDELRGEPEPPEPSAPGPLDDLFEGPREDERRRLEAEHSVPDPLDDLFESSKDEASQGLPEPHLETRPAGGDGGQRLAPAEGLASDPLFEEDFKETEPVAPPKPASETPKKSAVNPMLVLIIGLLLGALVTLLMDRGANQPEADPEVPGDDVTEPAPEEPVEQTPAPEQPVEQPAPEQPVQEGEENAEQPPTPVHVPEVEADSEAVEGEDSIEEPPPLDPTGPAVQEATTDDDALGTDAGDPIPDTEVVPSEPIDDGLPAPSETAQ